MCGRGTSTQQAKLHCVKIIRIRDFSGSYFPAFGLNTERYSVSLRIRSECGKVQTRTTPNTDAFHAVLFNKIRQFDDDKTSGLLNKISQ